MAAEPRRYQGVVVEWDGQKRCGFLQPRGTSSRDDLVFLSERAFIGKHRAPKLGDKLTYELERLSETPKTRRYRSLLRAGRVAFEGSDRPIPSNQSHEGNLLPLGIAYVGIFAAVSMMFRQLVILLGVALSCSFITFGLYGWDKFAAKRGYSRVPERQLHLFSLLGGWPGAVLAQELFRHKTRKQSFQTTFRIIVAVNILLMMAIAAISCLNNSITR